MLGFPDRTLENVFQKILAHVPIYSENAHFLLVSQTYILGQVWPR